MMRTWNVLPLAASVLSVLVVVACGGDDGADLKQTDMVIVDGVGNVGLGAPPFRHIVTTESGRPTTASAQTPAICTVDGSGLITVTSLGTCDIAYAVSSDKDYNRAVSLISFKVLKPASVAFDSMELEQSWPATGLAVSATSDQGFTVVYMTSSKACTVDSSTGAVTAIELGTCEIRAVTPETADHVRASAAVALEIVAGQQQVTLSPLADVEAQSGPRPVVVTAAGPVTLSAGPAEVCTLTTAGEVSAVGAGTCTVVAEAAATPTYQAGRTTTSFEVLRRVDRVSIVVAGSARFGETAAPALSSESGRLVALTSSTEGVCRVDRTTGEVVMRGVGGCVLVGAVGADALWGSARAQVTITVAPAQQQITVAPVTDAVALGTAQLASATDGDGILTYESLSSGVCTVGAASGLVTLVRAGDCRVAVTAAATSRYESARSVASFTVSPAKQVITLPKLTTREVTAAPFAVAAASSSGLPVALTSSTPTVCTVNALSVTVRATGTCSVVAAQSGDDRYSAAPSVTRSFTVTKAAQTMTFPVILRHGYAGPDFTVTASASSGLPVTFSSLTTAVCRVTKSGVVDLIFVGTCMLKAVQAGNATYRSVSATQFFDSVEGCGVGIVGRPEGGAGRIVRAC